MRTAANDRRLRIGMMGVALGALLVGLLLYSTSLADRPENATIDARFSIRGEQRPSDEVVVVGIDDRTFQALDQRWPFPRSLHGRLLDRLRADGVAAVAYDVQFTEPTSAREDNFLVSAVARTTRAGIPVILATEEVDDRGRTNVFGGEAVLDSIGARAASSTFEPDPGGVWRRLTPSVGGLVTIPIALVEERDGARVDPRDFPDEGALIDFAGPPGTIPTYSFSDVLSGRVGPEQLDGRTVVVGATSPSLQDVHAVSTSGEGLMPGAEVIANSITTITEGLSLEEVPWPLGALLIALLALGVPLMAALDRFRFGAVVVAGFLSGLLYLIACQLFFAAGVVLPVIAPVVALLVAAVGAIAVQSTVEAFERQRVRDTFARFVPPAVVDEVLEQTGGDLRAGAARRECAVMFSDIRGFTTFSETREPDEVVAILNRYLEAMTDAIMDHGGAVVSYLGDGIMAVFGAPLEQKDFTDRAVEAAREMVGSRLEGFNEWLRSEGVADGFRMGVGINTGEVMFGQVGSERRVDFTVIGDTTNTASRLEGMTKDSGYEIFVSDSTKERLGPVAAELIEVGELEVRGRSGAVRVWAVPTADPQIKRGENGEGGIRTHS